MPSPQNNFDYSGSSLIDWYSRAAGMEFQTTWSDLPLFKGGDIAHLEFMRCQTCWLSSDPEDLAVRKRAVQSLARAILSPTDVPDNELQQLWPLIGTESISPKIADAVCTLYNDAPYREFYAAKEGEAVNGFQEAFTELYDEFDVNLAFQEAYRSALFTNVVALMPRWNSNSVRVLTPDYFRLVLGDEGLHLWIALGDGGWSKAKFEVWTANEKKIVDHDGKLESREKNPYGRIPATILKLNRSNDLYGSGLSEAAEIAAWGNLIKLMSTRVAVFQSYSVAVLNNLKIKPGTRIGPGYALEGTNPIGEAGAQPSFEYVSPDGKFQELEDYRRKAIDHFCRTQGLPPHLVDEGAGQPPTGAALQVMERTLNDIRRRHTYALTKAEKDFAELMAIGAKVHPGKYATRELTTQGFTIQYADVQTFNDPASELKHDQEKAEAGLINPREYALKYTGQRFGTDEEAAKAIADNKKFFVKESELRSTVGGAQSILQAQIAYKAGQITQEQGMTLAINVYQYPPEVAALFFPANIPITLPTTP